jgi:hypothetical protein
MRGLEFGQSKPKMMGGNLGSLVGDESRNTVIKRFAEQILPTIFNTFEVNHPMTFTDQEFDAFLAMALPIENRHQKFLAELKQYLIRIYIMEVTGDDGKTVYTLKQNVLEGAAQKPDGTVVYS